MFAASKILPDPCRVWDLSDLSQSQSVTWFSFRPNTKEFDWLLITLHWDSRDDQVVCQRKKKKKKNFFRVDTWTSRWCKYLRHSLASDVAKHQPPRGNKHALAPPSTTKLSRNLPISLPPVTKIYGNNDTARGNSKLKAEAIFLGNNFTMGNRLNILNILNIRSTFELVCLNLVKPNPKKIITLKITTLQKIIKR